MGETGILHKVRSKKQGLDVCSKEKMDFESRDMLPDKPITDKECKIRVTIMIDMDIFMTLNKEADRKGVHYHSVINNYLSSQLEKE